MARTASYLGSPKTVSAGVVQTITWTSSEIDSTGVIGFLLGLQPVGLTLALLDRIRVRAAGQLLCEWTIAQLQAFNAAWNRANYSPTAGNFLYIPLNLIDAPTMEQADQCQFPPGAEAQVELVTLNTAVAGTAILGWVISNQVPKFFMRHNTSQGNIPASVKNGKFLFSDSGLVRAIAFPTAGVDRAELTISGQRAFNLPGPQFQGLVYGDLLSGKDDPDQGANFAGGIRYRATPLMLPAGSGSSNLILDTGAGWAGVANEIAIYSIDDVKNFRGR